MKALDRAAKRNGWTPEERARVWQAVEASPRDLDKISAEDVEKVAHAIGVLVPIGRRLWGVVKSLWPF